MTKQFRVQDATCGHCKSTIESAVSDVHGVRSVELNLDTKVLTVDLDDTGSPDAVAAAVSKAGYTPEVAA